MDHNLEHGARMFAWIKQHQQTRNTLLRYVIYFFLINTVLLCLAGLPYLTSIISSETLTRNFIADYSTTSGTILIYLYSVTNYLCYIMFLAGIVAALSALLAVLLPFKRIIIPITIIVYALTMMILIIDVNTYLLFKFHLNTTLIKLTFSPDWRDMLDLSSLELAQIILIGSGIILIEIIIAIIVSRVMIQYPARRLLAKILSYWACCTLLCYITLMLSISLSNNLFIHQAPNLPLYTYFISKITPLANAENTLQGLSENHYEQTFFSNKTLNYPRHPLQCHVPATPTNIIIIMVDALRADSLRHMPKLREFARDSWQFSNHVSAGNSTQAGIFSFFYSIPSNYWTAALKQQRAPAFMDLLRKYGYTMHAFWSASMQAPPMDRTVFLNFNTLTQHGADGIDTAARDQSTTLNAKNFLQEHALHQQPFFLHILYDAPHAFCSSQRFAKPHLPDAPNCSRLMLTNQPDRNAFFNNYLNAVHFVDQEISILLQTISDSGLLKNSVVIISSDHGQEFDDTHHGYWGHCSNYSSFQTKVPLIIHWPDQTPKVIQHQTCGYDLIPTILDRLFHCKNSHEDYSIGYDLLQKSGRIPFVLAGSYVTMGLIESNRITTLHASGEIDVTNLSGEKISRESLAPATYQLALRLMRKYFH